MEKEVRTSLYNEYDPEIQELFKEAKAFGIKVSDKKQFVDWINYKVSQVQSFEIVHQKLRETHYDLKIADKLITDESQKKRVERKSETALEKVEKISSNLREKARITKKNKMIAYIFTAAVISGVGFYVANLMEGVIQDISLIMLGDFSSFFTMFISVSWAIGIIAAVVTLALLGKFIYDYHQYKKSVKKNE